MASVADPDGVVWAVRRRWWPFVDVSDVVDGFFFNWAALLLLVPFALLWPIWLITKVLGVRWRILIERDGRQVDTELARGWAASQTRIAQLASEIARGHRSGRFVIV